MTRIKRPTDMSGEMALLASVIAQATKDATESRVSAETRADARAFFAGPVYEDYATWLGLPPGILPERISEAIHEQKEGENG